MKNEPYVVAKRSFLQLIKKKKESSGIKEPLQHPNLFIIYCTVLPLSIYQMVENIACISDQFYTLVENKLLTLFDPRLVKITARLLQIYSENWAVFPTI